MSYHHAVVWVDHTEAHVLFLADADVEKAVVAAGEHPHMHHKRGAIGPGKAAEDQRYYHGIVEALRDAREILITGPGQAKLELFKHMQHHDPVVAARVLGLESSDHPTDGQLAAHARHYFSAKDKMLGDQPERSPSPAPSGDHAHKASTTHAAAGKRAPGPHR